MDEDELNPGILDGMLAPFGEGLVNPNGAVTGMMGYTEPAPVQTAPVQQDYVAPAPVEPGTARTGLSRWNPFTLLFGDPNNPNQNGALMGGGQPEPTNFGSFTQNAQYDYPAPAATAGSQPAVDKVPDQVAAKPMEAQKDVWRGVPAPLYPNQGGLRGIPVGRALPKAYQWLQGR